MKSGDIDEKHGEEFHSATSLEKTHLVKCSPQPSGSIQDFDQVSINVKESLIHININQNMDFSTSLLIPGESGQDGEPVTPLVNELQFKDTHFLFEDRLPVLNVLPEFSNGTSHDGQTHLSPTHEHLAIPQTLETTHLASRFCSTQAPYSDENPNLNNLFAIASLNNSDDNAGNTSQTCLKADKESRFEIGVQEKRLSKRRGYGGVNEVVLPTAKKPALFKPKTPSRPRVDILSLDVVDSPLQKDGRHTIICGRLPDNNPYAIAARGLGQKMVSKKHSGFQTCEVESERRLNFLKDWKAFHEELLGYVPKRPVIGGGELDIFSLAHEVLLLGGVLNVVKKRAFRVVAQQLELPKSCTSAASVLKNAYERLLFYYEGKLVHDRMPQDVSRKLDMKRMEMEEKERERKAVERLARMMLNKKRNHGSVDLLIDIGDCTDVVESGCFNREDPRVKRIMLAVSERPDVTMNYLDLIVGQDIEDLMLPEWNDTCDDTDSDESLRVMLREALQMDQQDQVQSGTDVVFLALAECLQPSSLQVTGSSAMAKDLGLARALCTLPFSSPNMSRALGLMIMIVMKISKTPLLLLLSERKSTYGLLDGLFYLIHRYTRIKRGGQDEYGYSASNDEVLSAAFCSLSVIQAMLKEQQNRSKVISNVGFRHVVARFLGGELLNRSFLLVILDIITTCTTLMVELLGDADMDLFLSSLLRRLELATGVDPEVAVEEEIEKEIEVAPDYEVSSKVLPILVTLTRHMGSKSRNVGRLLALCVRLMHCQERVADNTSLALVIFTVTERLPKIVAKDKEFVRGVFKLIRDPTCVDVAAEALIIINRVCSIREFAVESGLFEAWKTCSENEDTALAHFVDETQNSAGTESRDAKALSVTVVKLGGDETERDSGHVVRAEGENAEDNRGRAEAVEGEAASAREEEEPVRGGSVEIANSKE